MKVVILAGGLGLRLKESVAGKPKVMAQVGSKPFLEHVLGALKSYGLTEIILCSGFKKELFNWE